MFTDPAIWKKPAEEKYSLSLGQYPINDFTYRLIKLKNYTAEEFEGKIGENPLAAAYLPLTDYPKEERPLIKAKAMSGIAGIPEGKKRATLYSLIQESIKLDSEEEKQFRELVRTNPMYQEVKMLESVEEVGIEKGMEIGVEKGIGIGVEKTAKNLLRGGWLTPQQIAEATGLDIAIINELAESLTSGEDEAGQPERVFH
jgi:predicted transposase/invertase (TIGR01784 family)